MDKINFKATIQVNPTRILDTCKSDRFFSSETNIRNLSAIISRIQNLSHMSEKSIVSISPRLDNNKLNLICSVSDDSQSINTTINERSARKISTEADFANRFISNIANAIKNVDKTKISIDKIKAILQKIENIKDESPTTILGFNICLKSKVGFIEILPQYIYNSINNGFNPTERIISILEKISKEYPNENNFISIKNIKSAPAKHKQSRINTYFCIQNSQGEKRIPMHILMKDPAEKLFG